MSTADIGGAAQVGRVRLPDPIDVDITAGEQEEYAIPSGEISERVRRNTVSNYVIYPDMHPANMEGVEMDSSGAIVIKKGQGAISKPNHNRSIDIKKDPRGVFTDTNRQQTMDKLDSLVSVAERNNTKAGDHVAKDTAGGQMTRILFHTNMGDIVTHCHQYSQEGSWIILGFDTTKAAIDRFVPQPFAGEDGSPGRVSMTVHQPDGSVDEVAAVPVGLSFSMFGYDFVALLRAGE